MKETPPRSPAGNQTAPFLLAALITLCGLEMMRVLFSLSLFVLRDRLEWEVVNAGLIIFALFLAAFLAALLRRLVRDRWLLLLTAGGLGLLRLLLQLWTGDPIGTLLLAGLGVFCFWLSWPFLLATLDLGRSAPAGFRLALGILTGLLLDVALTGLYGTYDRVWAGGLPALLLTLLVVGLLWFFLARHLRRLSLVDRPDLPWSRAWLWLALGPFLALQLLWLGNLARLNTLTGWGLPAALAWLLLAHLLGLLLANLLPVMGLSRALVPLGALVLALLLFFLPWSAGWAGALLLLFGQLFFAGSLALALGGMSTHTGRSGLARLTTIHGLTGLLLVILLFAYYAGFDMALPLDNNWLPAIAGLLVALPALAGAWLWTTFIPRTTAPILPWRALGTAFVLLLIPLVMVFTRRAPTPIAAAAPVRVINYNLHNGFGTSGRLDLEALAQMIENADPDVVALQEVSRGWVINGSVDMLDWLSHRLDMPYIFGATADPLWGNAVLSRYAILDSDTMPLPPDDLLLGRGCIHVRVAAGNGAYLDLWDMHLHHLPEAVDSDIRVAQIAAILADWNGAPQALIVGDTNAEMPTPEMQLFLEAGLLEAVATAGIDPPFTNGAADPWRQIDYIWYTPDLAATDVSIPRSQASDHFPVVATFSLAE